MMQFRNSAENPDELKMWIHRITSEYIKLLKVMAKGQCGLWHDNKSKVCIKPQI